MLSMCSTENDMIIIELSKSAIKLQKKEVKDLETQLKNLPTCNDVHILIDNNVNPDQIVAAVTATKNANCVNVSIQSVIE